MELHIHETELYADGAVNTRPEGRGVQSLARGLAILEALGAREDAGLLEIAAATGLSRSTAHRLLATLADSGYVEQEARHGRYRVTHQVLALAGGARARTERLRVIARPYLLTLRNELDETANLAVPEQSFAVYVDQIPSSRAIRSYTEIGSRVPAYACATGKAMLAFGESAAVEERLAADGLLGLTPHTLTTREALTADLERIRAAGYAVDREEYEEGVGCVAAAILDGSGAVAGAVGISAPIARLERTGIPQLGERLVGYARDIASHVGRAGT